MSNLLGKSKSGVIKKLQQTHLKYSEFCHWIFVPAWGLVISFTMTKMGMTCCQVGKIG